MSTRTLERGGAALAVGLWGLSLVLPAVAITGGPVLRGFALALFIGIILGTYSTIYVASALLIWLSRRYGHPAPAKVPGRARATT